MRFKIIISILGALTAIKVNNPTAPESLVEKHSTNNNNEYDMTQDY